MIWKFRITGCLVGVSIGHYNFQCAGKRFFVEFQGCRLKFRTIYLNHIFKVVQLIKEWNIKSPWVYELVSFLKWWRHQMETFTALLVIYAGNSPVPGDFPTQRQVKRSFDVFFYLRLNKRLCKQWWGWWFETLSRPLWRHRNEMPPKLPVWFWCKVPDPSQCPNEKQGRNRRCRHEPELPPEKTFHEIIIIIIIIFISSGIINPIIIISIIIIIVVSLQS